VAGPAGAVRVRADEQGAQDAVSAVGGVLQESTWSYRVRDSASRSPRKTDERVGLLQYLGDR